MRRFMSCFVAAVNPIRRGASLPTAFRRGIVAILACQLVVGSVAAERVVRVKDGDSIVVRSGDNEVDVRIADIDAPELDQAYGKVAKAALDGLVGERDVRLELVGGDRYRRIVANVFVEGLDAAELLVGQGYAWVRRAYTSSSRLIRLEDEARRARRGLWADAEPIPPWFWRQGVRRPGAEPTQRASSAFTVECGAKRYCHEMGSCEEAVAYLYKCRVDTIDGDGDGIPCESLCRYQR
ncbi:MAG: thermonuclease family protein [Gammaproteobacteria bacterium]|nr:thermonuclease family protein [Gammaproteobacteria bacterium]